MKAPLSVAKQGQRKPDDVTVKIVCDMPMTCKKEGFAAEKPQLGKFKILS
ncbi:MAG: hypothetical protein ACN6NT_08465 [Comamonas sp.]